MNMPILTQFAQNQKTIEIDGIQIRQDQYGRYCLNDLHKASGSEQKNQPRYFLENKQTQDLAQALIDSGIPLSPIEVIRGGLDQGTYVVKELVYSYAMWISPVFNLKVIRTFDAMVTQKPVELSRMDLIQLALAAEQENIALKQHVAELAPKAEALDTIADTTNTYCLRNCAKTIGIKESELIQLLIDKKWIYREPSKTPGKSGKLQPHAQYVTNKVFINRISPVITNQYTGQEMVHTNMRVTAFGLTRITGLVNKNRKVAA